MAHIRRHPKSGSWQVRYRGPDGRERSKTFARKVDADAFAATVTADVLRGDYIDPKAGKVTVAEMAERWQATRSHLARSTQDQDRHYLASLVLPTFGNRSIASIRPSEVAAWFSQLGRAPATKAKALQKLSSILQLAVTDGALKSNPCDSVRRIRQQPKRPARVLDEAEMRVLIEAAEAVDGRTAVGVWLMAEAGLRIGEVLGLKRSDLDGATLRIRGSMSRREGIRPTKTPASDRAIPLGVEVMRRLRLHLAQATPVSLEGWLLTSPRGRPVRYDNWRSRVWSRIVERSGLGDVIPHDLRHTFITRRFTEDGWSVPQVQAYVGHSDPAVTLKVYTHIAADTLPQPGSIGRAVAE